jgi:hypothetical protein
MTEEIKTGSVGISKSAHQLLVGLVQDNEKCAEDRPFESIVEAFRFAFALGYSQNNKLKSSGGKEGVAPRQFNVNDYLELLRDEVMSSNQSLGGLISEYAEYGCQKMSDKITNGGSILELIK